MSGHPKIFPQRKRVVLYPERRVWHFASFEEAPPPPRIGQKSRTKRRSKKEKAPAGEPEDIAGAVSQFRALEREYRRMNHESVASPASGK